ncbi:MAG: YSC84-related protein [Coraliomargarita sp.]
MRTCTYIHSLAKTILLSALLTALIGCASTGKGTNDEKRAEIQKSSKSILEALYKANPGTKEYMQKCAGYATFSNANVNLIFVAAGGGYGLAKDKSSGEITYMNMGEGGVGFGLGAKDYSITMFFMTQDALDKFIASGWAFGANADATAQANDKGGSADGEVYTGDVKVYSMTETGLALQATVKGTKFWVDKHLN